MAKFRGWLGWYKWQHLPGEEWLGTTGEEYVEKIDCTISVRIPSEQAKALKQKAQEESAKRGCKVTVSDLLRAMIERITNNDSRR